MYLIKNGRIHKKGGVILSGWDILVEGNRIKKIGENLSAEGAQVIEAGQAEIFPGMILPATAVGITDFTNTTMPDSTEWAKPVYPQLSVRYSLDMREVHLQEYARSGITAFGACPGNKALIAGQTGVYHTYGASAKEMELFAPAALKANFTSDVKTAFGTKDCYPMTKMGMAALMRSTFSDPPLEGKTVIQRVLNREIPLLVNVNTEAEAETMLAICEEFGFRMILQGAYDLTGLEERLIRMKDSVSVLAGDQYSLGLAVEYGTKAETYQHLLDGGVTVGLSNGGDGGMTGKEVMLWSGIKLVSQGLLPHTVMDMMTVNNAMILGVEDQIGAIEEGFRADLVIWSADPVQTYQSQVLMCMEDGKILLRQEKPDYQKPARAGVEAKKCNTRFMESRSYLIKNACVYGTDENEGTMQDVLVRDGKIARVGGTIETEDAEIVDAEGFYLLPGFVDAHCHQGGFGILHPQDADLNEMTNPITPQVRAIDAVDIRDRNFQQMHKIGVTSACITPGSGNVICGQAFATKTCGGSIREMVLRDPCALKIALGGNPKGEYGKKGQQPMTRMGIAAILFNTFEKAADYKSKKERGENPAYNEQYEAMIPALNGDIPLKIHCEQFDMMTAIELAEKYHCSLTIEHAWAAADHYEELVSSGCFINFGPVGVPEGYGEMTGADLRMAAELERRGTTVSLITDAPIFSEDILYTQMGEVIRAGIPYEGVLKMVTENPARALGIECRTGRIAEGRDADLALFSRLPGLDADAECQAVWIDGKLVYQREE